MPTAQPKRYYSVKEAAQLLSVSTNTIYTYLDTGKLRGRRIGRGRFKIPFRELQPYVDDNFSEKPQTAPLKNETNNPSVNSNTSLTYNVVPQEESYNLINTRPAPKTETPASGVIPVEVNLIDKKNPEENTAPVKIENTKGGSEIISMQNDKIFWRLFKALAMIGLGIIYIFTGSRVFDFNGSFLQESGEVLKLLMPYGLVTAGFLVLLDAFVEDWMKPFDMFIHTLSTFVLSYFAFIAIASGEYGRFVFAGGLAFLLVSHMIQGVRHEGTFYEAFIKYVAITSIIGGVVILMDPTLFPIPFATQAIEANKGVFAIGWFGLVAFPALFFLSEGGRRLKSFSTLFFLVQGVVTLIYATELAINEKWDISYITYLMGIFGLFLSWWRNTVIIIPRKNFAPISLSLSWVAIAVLIGLFVTSGVSSKLRERGDSDRLSELVDAGNKVEKDINAAAYLLTSVAGSAETANVIEGGKGEAAINKAKEIYEKSSLAKRVLIYNKEGVAVGVYPRETLAQGTDFSSREYFRKSKEENKGSVTGVLTTINGGKAIIVTEPVFKDNEFFGMVGLGIDIEKYSLLISENLSREEKIHVFDSEGKYAFGSNPEEIGKSKNDLSILGLQDYKQNTTDNYKIYQYNIPSYSWNLYLVAPPPGLASESSYINILLSVFLFVNSAFSIFGGIALSGRKQDYKNLNLQSSALIKPQMVLNRA